MTVRLKADLTRLPFWAAVFVALICAAILALTGLREWSLRETALKTAEVNVANLARSMLQHAEDSFDLMDASILGAVGRLDAEGTAPKPSLVFARFLRPARPACDRVPASSLLTKTATGSHRQARRVPTSATVNTFAIISNRPRGRYFGPPFESRINADWITTVSRRFNHPDGSFAGIVLATIGANYFSEFYRQFSIGAHGAITLFGADGIVKARSFR